MSSAEMAPLTDRQRREAEYYREYVRRNPVARVDFAPVLSRERRPWSPYWHLCQSVRDLYRDPSQRLLEIGCGSGVASLLFTRIGFQVEAFDVASANVEAAGQLARQHGLADRCRFQVMTAEALGYPDNHFDVVVGVDILHHVEVAGALAEVRRVLRPGGWAVFKEPYAVPLLEWLRTSRLGQRLAPRNKSFDHHVHITDDERKLTRRDLDAIAQELEVVDVSHFSLLNRLSRFIPKRYARLMWLDYQMFRLCPPIRRLGDVRILRCRKAA